MVRSWTRPERSWTLPGRSLGAPGRALGAPGRALGAPWARHERIMNAPWRSWSANEIEKIAWSREEALQTRFKCRLKFFGRPFEIFGRIQKNQSSFINFSKNFFF